MKPLRIFLLISCFVITLYFLIFSFSDISIAAQTRKEKCISSCDEKQQVCFNINADKRVCAVEFQNCVAPCNSEDDTHDTPDTPNTADTPSSTQQGSNSTENLK